MAYGAGVRARITIATVANDVRLSQGCMAPAPLPPSVGLRRRRPVGAGSCAASVGWRGLIVGRPRFYWGSLGGCGRAVVIPLYPQFSTSTTASTLDDLRRHAPEEIRATVVERHADRGDYLDVMADILRNIRAEAPEDAHVLFTAHSIPESFTRDGDPYVDEIQATVRGIARRVDLSDEEHSLAYQSVGPVGSWHGPSWEESLERLHDKGTRALLVQPLSFVSENLETLWDLDIEMRGRCDTLGVSMRRVPTPGVSAKYSALLADLATEAAEKEGWL